MEFVWDLVLGTWSFTFGNCRARFYLGLTTAIANVGKYKFTPVSHSYKGIVRNQTAQNYDALVFGDTSSGFVELLDGSSQSGAKDGTSADKVAALECVMNFCCAKLDYFNQSS